MAGEAGRDPAGIEITSFALGEDLDRVKGLNEMGVARVVPMFPPETADKVAADRRPVDKNHAAGQRVKPGRIDPR